MSRWKLVKYFTLFFSECPTISYIANFFLYIDNESLEAEMKKLEKMQEKVKNMQQQQRKDELAAKKSKPFSFADLVSQ